MTSARMTLPIVKPECITKGKVDLGDQIGALKLWPGERLRVKREITSEALLCEFGKHTLLVLTPDTTPSPL